LKLAAFNDTLKNFFREIFGRPWPEHLAGILLGTVNIIFYAWALKPYTIFSGYQVWGQHVYNIINLGWLSGAPMTQVLQDKTSVGIIGLVLGASIAAILSKEFRVRLPKSKLQVIEAIFGGILMSFGVVLSFGCNWGGFFSAITALSLHGWAMFLGLIVGGYLGQLYTRYRISFEIVGSKDTFVESTGKPVLGRWMPKILLTSEALFIILALAYYGSGFAGDGALYSVILFFGILVGIIIQRSRFCFTTAFRDLFYGPEFDRSIRIHKGIVLGLLIGVTGTFVLKYRGFVEPSNYVYPVSFVNILGGMVFAFGAVLAGACASGVLWRAGEGYVNALLTIFTAVLVYPILRKVFTVSGAGFFMPSLGWANGMVLTYILLLLYLAFIIYLEGRKR